MKITWLCKSVDIYCKISLGKRQLELEKMSICPRQTDCPATQGVPPVVRLLRSETRKWAALATFCQRHPLFISYGILINCPCKTNGLTGRHGSAGLGQPLRPRNGTVVPSLQRPCTIHLFR